jgi:hypothetical protein
VRRAVMLGSCGALTPDRRVTADANIRFSHGGQLCMQFSHGEAAGGNGSRLEPLDDGIHSKALIADAKTWSTPIELHAESAAPDRGPASHGGHRQQAVCSLATPDRGWLYAR